MNIGFLNYTKKRTRKMANLMDFDCLGVLGQGSFGKVHKVRKINGDDANEVYAMKQTKSEHEDCFTTEIDILKQIRHPFVVELFYTFEDEDCYYMVMEYLCRGTLSNILERTPIMSEQQASFYIKELILAVEYLHSKKIIYRDLKDSNTMLDVRGHVKLIDFGLSIQLEDHSSYDYCGTMAYMAPEVISKIGHGFPVDWWSLGVLLYKMTVGTFPFQKSATTSVRDAILIGEYFLPECLSENLQNLIGKLLTANTRRRLGYNGGEEVKNHIFFRNTCWNAVINCLEIPPFLPHLHDVLTVEPPPEPNNFNFKISSNACCLSKVSNDQPKYVEVANAIKRIFTDVITPKKKRKNKKKLDIDLIFNNDVFN